MSTIALLAAVAGFVDAACFLGLNEVFTAHVTGNIAGLASSLFKPSPVALLRVEVLIAFAVGAVAARIITLGRKADPGMRTLQCIVANEALWLALAVAAELLLVDGVSKRYAIAGCASAAMGCQSAASNLPSGIGLPTTVMTSNYTQWSISLLEALLARASGASQLNAAFARLVSMTVALLSFAGGAIAGAACEPAAGFVMLGVPLAALLVWSALTALRPQRA